MNRYLYYRLMANPDRKITIPLLTEVISEMHRINKTKPLHTSDNDVTNSGKRVIKL